MQQTVGQMYKLNTMERTATSMEQCIAAQITRSHAILPQTVGRVVTAIIAANQRKNQMM